MKSNAMNRFIATSILLFAVSLSANADVWSWTDAHGETHFVNTLKPIYTWFDESGKVWYADTPDHEDAVSVELVWHSSATDTDESGEGEKHAAEPHEKWAVDGETEEDRYERETAEKYYCDRAKEVYDSYLKAPRLYRTNDAGVREYLSDEESTQTLGQTEARVDELCNH